MVSAFVLSVFTARCYAVRGTAKASSQLSAGYYHIRWLVGWLVVGKSCRVSVRAINRSTSSAIGQWNSAASLLMTTRTARYVTTFISVIHRRFAIRVDSVPSWKLGTLSTRTRPRVVYLSVRPSVRLWRWDIVVI